MSDSKHITAFLKSLSAFSDEEINDFIGIGKDVKLAKGEFFISEGQTCKSFSFIHEGTFSFLVLNNADEYVKDFSK